MYNYDHALQFSDAADGSVMETLSRKWNNVSYATPPTDEEAELMSTVPAVEDLFTMEGGDEASLVCIYTTLIKISLLH